MFLKRKQVEAITGLSRSGIYAKLTHNPKRPGDFDADFPHPVRIGARAVAWIAAEIEAWIAKRVAKRDIAKAPPSPASNTR